MTLSARYYYSSPEGSFVRYPASKFRRLLNGQEGTCLPELAGQKARFIVVHHEPPQKVLEVTFVIYQFHADGTLDQQHLQAGLDLVRATFSTRSSGNLLDLVPVMAQRSYQRDYCWEPNPQETGVIQTLLHTQTLSRSFLNA